MSIPLATYRLQLTPNFGFDEACRVTDYLRELGISHLYLSPIWQAREGSTHGYDVIDPTFISNALGGEEAFVRLARSGLRLILDFVPNHMAADPNNPYWNDATRRAEFFDIDASTGFRRRFFDVDDLVGVRMEKLEVFSTTHSKVKELIERGLIDGLRIDHIDGLANPAVYLLRLKEMGVEHVWVEKILEPEEQLRDWPVEGTTGYDFLNDATALFVDPSAKDALEVLSGETQSFHEISRAAKREQVATTFTREVAELRSLVDAEEVGEALASLPVYRTYVDAETGLIEDEDRRALKPLPEPIRSILALEKSAPSEFVTRFQQTSGAVMAKGVEDTALYRDVRLLALNEVGGDPERFHLPVSSFHAANQRRLRRFPHSLLTSLTHDTKRSGDVRSRLVALTHRHAAWQEAAKEWSELNRSAHGSTGAPDWNEELFIYQTLVGGWPLQTSRLDTYLQKALREAKRNTNWIEPNEQWEHDVIEFVHRICHDETFLGRFEPFVRDIAYEGERVSLAQLVLRLTCPGVPDIYQGDESWNYSFVDPDNRRPVDWPERKRALASLSKSVGRDNAKLFVMTTLLRLRHRRWESFQGDYVPLEASDNVCRFRRGDNVIVSVAVSNGEVSENELGPVPQEGRWENVLQPLDEIYRRGSISVFERVSR